MKKLVTPFGLLFAGLLIIGLVVGVGLLVAIESPQEADDLIKHEISLLPQPEREKIADSLSHCKELLSALETERSFGIREQYLAQLHEGLRQFEAWSQQAALSQRTRGWVWSQCELLAQKVRAIKESDDASLKPSHEIANSCVRQYISDYFRDPYSVRDLVVGQPKFYRAAEHRPHPWGTDNQDWWLVPYWCNTKNGFGGYIGKKLYVLGLRKKDDQWWFNTGLGSDYFEMLYNDASVPSSSPTPQ